MEFSGQTNFNLSRHFRLACFCLLLTLVAPPARAALQFDVFLGYDGAIREANWFPLACEIFNDGPAFKGMVEVTTGQGGGLQVREVALELPTNTRKRFVIPVFSSAGRYGSWNVRLLDDRGKVRAEQLALRPKNDAARETILIGSLSRTFSGQPSLPNIRANRPDLQPLVARLEVNLFPDNPLALEGLDLIYLNTEKALDLKTPQVNALLGWVQGGGHLVVAVEQPGDVNATPWLRALLPCELSGVTTANGGRELQSWVQPPAAPTETESVVVNPSRPKPRNAPKTAKKPAAAGERTEMKIQPDSEFEQAPLPIASAQLRNGTILLGRADAPLMLQGERGRGRVTVLAFSPEREPFRSWKNKGWFWARLAEVPPRLFTSTDMNNYGGWSIDSVFGAMIDSRQVRKLPVSWLLLLLTVYLVVIGPLDQWWLKKINRQMLTWITFPAYVLIFSGLIYWIGFLLRAGEIEWNELHVVDVLPRGERADLRGRTFASVYSPANQRYEMASDPSFAFATLRGEFLGSWNGSQESSRSTIAQRGDGFRADIFVPVWVSQLYVSDWWRQSPAPLAAKISEQAASYRVTVENKLDHPVQAAKVVIRRRIYDLGEVPARQSRTFEVAIQGGALLNDFIQQNGSSFQQVIQSRRNAFGDTESGRLAVTPEHVIAASFSAAVEGAGSGQRGFVAPQGFDLNSLANRGQAILFAWDAGHSVIPALNQFSPRRATRDTLLRVAVPVELAATR